MKKLLAISILFSFVISTYAQHFVPVDILVDAKDVSISVYGGFSIDAGNGDELIKTLSNSGQSGFIVNALYRQSLASTGLKYQFHQFLVDINPIIINWDPFTWNKLLKQPVDSFNVNKMPFGEDAFLHIGWHYNIFLPPFFGSEKNQQMHYRIFSELYWRPYNIQKTTDQVPTDYRFQAFNFTVGGQISFVKKQVPILGNFLIGMAAQFNYMGVNESDAYLGSLNALMPNKGKNFIGPGAKIMVQADFLNIYIEGRQYYGIDKDYTGVKFTQEPIILVGASANLKWSKKKNPSSANNQQQHIID